MHRIFASMLALLIGGALATAGCSTFTGTVPAAESYGTSWGATGPSGTPGELPPGISGSGS